jgi:hypothetical protein
MKKTILSLLIQFTFLPQIIWAAFLHRKLMANSYVLTNGALQIALTVVFTEIVVFAVLTSIRRFYFTRYLLICAYWQLILTLIYFDVRLERFSALGNETYYFIAFGAIMTAINMIALYLKEKKNDGDYNRRG